MAWIQAGFEGSGGIEARIDARRRAPLLVMPGLVPGIHVLRHRGVSRERTCRWRHVGTRNKSGHDDMGGRRQAENLNRTAMDLFRASIHFNGFDGVLCEHVDGRNKCGHDVLGVRRRWIETSRTGH